MVYCTYDMLNMFRALLCPSSGARDYTNMCMCVITAYGVQYFGCWLPEVRCMAAGYASEMRDVAPLVQHPCPAPDLRQSATKALHTVGGNNTHIISSS